jgi:hypothetical protein
MRKQILSLAIALPTLLFGTLPGLADPAKIPQRKVDYQQPVLSVPKVQGVTVNKIRVSPGELRERRCPGRCLPTDLLQLKKPEVLLPSRELGGSQKVQQIAPQR